MQRYESTFGVLIRTDCIVIKVQISEIVARACDTVIISSNWEKGGKPKPLSSFQIKAGRCRNSVANWSCNLSQIDTFAAKCEEPNPKMKSLLLSFAEVVAEECFIWPS